MDASSILNNLVSSVLWAVIVLIGGGLLAWLRSRRSKWLPVLLYGLAGTALSLFCILAFNILVRLPPRTPPITPANVEASLKTWLDAFHLSSRVMPDEPDKHFALQVNAPTGQTIIVSRTKDRPDYLLINGGYLFTEDDRKSLSRMNEAQKAELTLDISAAIAGHQTGYGMQMPFQSIRMETQLPITQALTEAEFIRTLDEMNEVEVLVQATVERDILKALPRKPTS